jgi:hypothetical protein
MQDVLTQLVIVRWAEALEDGTVETHQTKWLLVLDEGTVPTLAGRRNAVDEDCTTFVSNHEWLSRCGRWHRNRVEQHRNVALPVP